MQDVPGNLVDLANWLNWYKASALERRAQREQAEMEALQRRRRVAFERWLERERQAQKAAEREPSRCTSRLDRLLAIADGGPDPWG